MLRVFVVLLLCLVGATAQAATKSEIAKVQRQLSKLGYDAGAIDGLWGGATRRALEAFLLDAGGEFDGTLDQNELAALAEEFERRGMTMGPTLNWEYRATSVGFGGYEFADQPVYDAIKSIREIPSYGFNTVTLDFRCTGKMDLGVPVHYPIGRRLGCAISNKQIWDDEGFVSNRRDATDLAIDEARAVGLAVNIKPMFAELGRRFGEKGVDGYGQVPLDVFFDGDGTTWSGYASMIVEIAKYAEANEAEYLTIGTELSNLNRKIPADPRWPSIVREIRSVYSGQLIYALNFHNESNIQNLPNSHVFRQVDIVGLNYFPTQSLGGRTEYTPEEVSIALSSARLKNGGKMMEVAKQLADTLSIPVILSEVSFPTWVGSANWMFRGGCDYKNEGRGGWQFTKGPLQAKTPSDEHGRILAEGYLLAFEDQNWVLGADFLFWTVAHAYDDRTDRAEYGPCSSWYWEKDNGIKELIRDAIAR